MEGPNIRRFPRTLFRCPIELGVGENIIHLDAAVGNLSVHGLFLQSEHLPESTLVRVKILAVPPLELDGVVRFCDSEGVGIEFTLDRENQLRLDDLIAQFLPREVLAGPDLRPAGHELVPDRDNSTTRKSA